MQSWWMQSDGSHSALELRELPVPQAGPGQLLVRIHAAGLNRGEFILGHGLHKAGAAKPIGMEGAGEVVEAGTGSRFKVGDRVMGRCAGAFAEYALMDECEALAVPAPLSWELAASVPTAPGFLNLKLSRNIWAALEHAQVFGDMVVVGVGLCVGAAVAAAGVIGFVGLMIPHLVRPFAGHRPSAVLFPSAIGGALLLVLADSLVRIAPTVSELRLGIAMSMLGGPFFLMLLLRLRRTLP